MQHCLLPFFIKWCLQPDSHCASAAGRTVLAHLKWRDPGSDIEHPAAQKRLFKQIVNTLCGQDFNVSKDRDCTTCLDNLLQSLMTPYTKLEFPVFLCLLLLALLLCTLEKTALSSLHLPIRKQVPALGSTEMNLIIVIYYLKMYYFHLDTS